MLLLSGEERSGSLFHGSFECFRQFGSIRWKCFAELAVDFQRDIRRLVLDYENRLFDCAFMRRAAARDNCIAILLDRHLSLQPIKKGLVTGSQKSPQFRFQPRFFFEHVAGVFADVLRIVGGGIVG